MSISAAVPPVSSSLHFALRFRLVIVLDFYVILERNYAIIEKLCSDLNLQSKLFVYIYIPTKNSYLFMRA